MVLPRGSVLPRTRRLRVRLPPYSWFICKMPSKTPLRVISLVMNGQGQGEFISV